MRSSLDRNSRVGHLIIFTPPFFPRPRHRGAYLWAEGLVGDGTSFKDLALTASRLADVVPKTAECDNRVNEILSEVCDHVIKSASHARDEFAVLRTVQSA